MYIYRNHHNSSSFTSRRMDVVPDNGLFYLLDGLCKDEEAGTSPQVSVVNEEKGENERDLWSDIADALNN